MTAELFERCADGHACIEVVARSLAADVAAGLGYRDGADRLRSQARSWAERHHHGTAQRDAPEDDS